MSTNACRPLNDAASAWADLRDVLLTSLPIIVTFTSQTVMSFVDAVMLANHAEASLAAVSAARVATFLLIAMVLGVNWCVNTFVAQSVGRNRPREAAAYVPQGVYISLGFQLLFVPAILFAGPVFRLIDHDGQLPDLEAQYFRIVMLRSFGAGALVSFSSFFIGVKKPAIPMYTGVVANVANLGINYALIFGKMGLPELGIAGAAIGTAAATYIETALLLAVFLSAKYRRDYGTGRVWRPARDKCAELLRVGAPHGLGIVIDLASWTFFVNLIVGKLGESALAAHGAVVSIRQVVFIPMVGFNIALGTLVGQRIGEKDPCGAERRMRLAIRSAVLFSAAIAMLIVVFGEPLLSVFAATESSRLVKLGKDILPLAGLSLIFQALSLVGRGGLKGAGDTTYPAVASVVFSWIVFIPMAYFLADAMHLVGAWIATMALELMLGLAIGYRIRSGKWKERNIFSTEEESSAELTVPQPPARQPQSG